MKNRSQNEEAQKALQAKDEEIKSLREKVQENQNNRQKSGISEDQEYKKKIAAIEEKVEEYESQAKSLMNSLEMARKKIDEDKERMKELGSKSVKVKNAGRFDHRTCALYASVYTKMYFDSFSKKGSTKGRKGPVFKRMLISIAKIGTPKSKLEEPEGDPLERYLQEGK